MPTILDSFFVKLGFQVDTKGLGAMEHKVHSLHHAMEALGVLAGVELVKRLGEFVERAVEGAAGVQKLSEITGLAADEIAALDRVAMQGGVGIESMHDTIMGVVRATGAAAAGFPRFAKLFEQLGFSKAWLKQQHDAGDIMVALADKFKHMDAGMRMAVAGRLGIDPRMAAMMAEGGAAFREKMNEQKGQGLLSAEDYEAAHETEKTFTRLHTILNQVTTVIAVQLAPWVRKLTDAFEKWWRTNRTELIDKLKNGFHELGLYIDVAWSYMTRAWGAAKRLYEWFDKLGVAGLAFKGVLVGIVAVKLGSALADIASGLAAVAMGFKGVNLSMGLIGLMAIALVLAIDEIMTYLEGGESYIGDFQKKWSGAFQTLVTATELLGGALIGMMVKAGLAAMGVSASFSAIMLPLIPLLIACAAFYIVADAIIDAWEPLKQWFSELWDDIVNGVKTALEWLLKIPGAKAYFDLNTGGAATRFVDERESQRNFELSKQQNGAFDSSRYAPSSIDAQGNGVWKLDGNTSTSVKIDHVEIRADKGREETVGNQLGDQMKTAAGLVRTAQSGVKI